MTARRTYLLLLSTLVVALFVAGGVWRALHPNRSENPDQDVQFTARQDGYYLCLHHAPLSVAGMYRLVRRKLPRDPLAPALLGCREAQRH
jgi:hypothetical protein